MDKYCRICWNTKNWRQPTGEATELETGESYVAEKGFGHEEWLFNFSWLLSGSKFTSNIPYRYGFLQPINKFYKKYKGSSFSVLLYTRSPEGKCLLVAKINGLYVPDEDELNWAIGQMNNKGWIALMQKELELLGIDSTPLKNPIPNSIANVRFSADSVTFYDPRPIVDGNHKICRSPRYQPFNWDDTFPVTQQNSPIPPTNQSEDEDPTRSEEARTRAAVESTSYDPRHVKLQNSLYRKLCSLYGQSSVDYEKDFVDIILRHNQITTFIEIKTHLTAKRCIRDAIGQLLEYCHYPSISIAHELLVVGDVVPTQDDILYISTLRDTYNIPLKYSRWNWSQNALETPV